jgi:hypothetical protein
MFYICRIRIKMFINQEEFPGLFGRARMKIYDKMEINRHFEISKSVNRKMYPYSEISIIS